MHIAYMTHDEVHRDLALRTATQCGVTVHPIAPNDPPTDEQFDAVVYDLDSLPSRRREEVIEELRDTSLPRAMLVAIHTYHINHEISALRRRGVVVVRRLGPCLLRYLALCRTIAPRRANIFAPQTNEWLQDPFVVLAVAHA